MSIPLNDIEQFLVSGWTNTQVLDLSRLIQPGQVLTIVLSDGPFDVPSVLPGGNNTIASRQYEAANPALVKVRVVERS